MRPTGFGRCSTTMWCKVATPKSAPRSPSTTNATFPAAIHSSQRDTIDSAPVG